MLVVSSVSSIMKMVLTLTCPSQIHQKSTLLDKKHRAQQGSNICLSLNEQVQYLDVRDAIKQLNYMRLI